MSAGSRAANDDEIVRIQLGDVGRSSGDVASHVVAGSSKKAGILRVGSFGKPGSSRRIWRILRSMIADENNILGCSVCVNERSSRGDERTRKGSSQTP